jgi:malate-CoA ligase subunit beta
VTLPLVVRLAGTSVEEGRKILAESGFPIISADSLSDAAAKVVAAWRAHGQPRRQSRHIAEGRS